MCKTVFLAVTMLALLSAGSTAAQGPRPCYTSEQSPVCRVTSHGWTAESLHERLAGATSAVWAEGNRLTFAYEGDVYGIWLCCGLQDYLERLKDSDLWVYTVEITGLDQAVISYAFFEHQAGANDLARLAKPLTEWQVWRGKKAPPAAPKAEPLAGEIQRHPFKSTALGEERTVLVYLPPDHDPDKRYPVVYAADGQVTPELAAYLEPWILDGTLPPTIIVGTASAISTSERDLRSEEYLPSYGSSLFASHETFFTDEVRRWAESNLGASTLANQRAVFGFSSGGVVAAAMGIRHPDLYGYALSFSPGISPGSPPNSSDEMAHFYLLAGTLEIGFHQTASKLYESLKAVGATVEFHEWVAGHDYVMWDEIFPQAVIWAFG